MSTPNWGKLVSQGRSKTIGVPWSEEEMQAVLTIAKAFNKPDLRTSADYVRRGALTVEAAEKLIEADLKQENETGTKPVEAMSRQELESRVKESQPHITSDAPTEVLRDTLEADKKKAEAEKAEAEKAEAEKAEAEKAKSDKETDKGDKKK